ncbi:MAG: serine/threonine protein phosphatase [Myxococcales bacterium]|nr:serine/threonine protein phosphatase [Myxococcales bacterium]
MDRTIAIGDIHGDLEHLERLLAKLPDLDACDTVVFLGDYIDRGPASREVIERVERFRTEFPGRCVTLRGNHEDAWLDCWEKPNPGFLLPQSNGCLETLRSFVDCAGLTEFQTAARLLEPSKWLPASLRDWMRQLPTWYEDEHAIYVHAGLEGEGTLWLHPGLGRERPLMWMREGDFWTGYLGKRLVFGHTVTSQLPVDHLTWFQKIFDDKADVWFRADLIGVDTGCGKGGFLSAVELPSQKVYESR